MKERPVKVSPEWRAIKPFMETSLSLLKGGILSQVKRHHQGVKAWGRLKTFSSASEKLNREGKEYSNYQDITDLVKGVVLTQDLLEATKVVSFLLNHCEVVKWELKRGDRHNPYKGVYHIDILIGGLMCEIMVTSRQIWEVKKQSNRFYKTGQAPLTSPLWEGVNIPRNLERLVG